MVGQIKQMQKYSKIIKLSLSGGEQPDAKDVIPDFFNAG